MRLANNDMVRRGGWIEMPSFDADGDWRGRSEKIHSDMTFLVRDLRAYQSPSGHDLGAAASVMVGRETEETA